MLVESSYAGRLIPIMRIEDAISVFKVSDEESLHEVLSRRDVNGYNSFWLSHGEENHPCVSILVKEELAYAHYFPGDRGPGFASVGNPAILGLDPNAETAFYEGERTWILNSAVVTLPEVLAIATEFMRSPELPKCGQWLEL